MPLLTSPPLILNSSGEPANGVITARVTSQFANTTGDIITQAQSNGLIVAGVLRNSLNTAGFSLPTTPTGLAVEIYLLINEYATTGAGIKTVRRVVSVPSTATVGWADLTDVIPISTDSPFVIPTYVQTLITAVQAAQTASAASASGAATSATTATNAATSATASAATAAGISAALSIVFGG